MQNIKYMQWKYIYLHLIIYNYNSFKSHSRELNQLFVIITLDGLQQKFICRDKRKLFLILNDKTNIGRFRIRPNTECATVFNNQLSDMTLNIKYLYAWLVLKKTIFSNLHLWHFHLTLPLTLYGQLII